jgi:hypothetical protein
LRLQIKVRGGLVCYVTLTTFFRSVSLKMVVIGFFVVSIFLMR